MRQLTKFFGAMLLSLAVLGGARAADATKLKDAVVGKWTKKEKIGDTEVSIDLELTKDGKLHAKVGTFSQSGTYKIIDEKTIEFTMDYNGTKKSHTLSVKVEDGKLITTDEKKRVDTFERVKPK